ncbi:KH domain-containing protein [Accumulibacter sp.]|uniref:KH domain-containing protein n=1 Tax=Accumulibacter sp. TaxID=2053492 RepID=UPI00258AD0DC|nr:KH domain-containing protein [Accumulibacter sp.]
MVKRIASEARRDMERMFDGAVFLEVFVKVKSGWLTMSACSRRMATIRAWTR